MYVSDFFFKCGAQKLKNRKVQIPLEFTLIKQLFFSRMVRNVEKNLYLGKIIVYRLISKISFITHLDKIYETTIIQARLYFFNDSFNWFLM